MIVYKGMLTAPQMRGYYPDLRDPRYASKLALVHARFSTNTAPSWQLAQPYHLVCHNGEFNTLDGNRNWMSARHSRLGSRLFGDELVRLPTVLDEELSDSASLNAVLALPSSSRSVATARSPWGAPSNGGQGGSPGSADGHGLLTGGELLPSPTAAHGRRG